MTLESLSIRNFQCHRKNAITLSPTISCIVGDNGTGKSSILRALKSVLFCSPVYPAWKKTSSTITLKFDNHSLLRKKEKKRNLYKLDGKKFKAFRKTVPDEIASLLNVHPVNYQGQLDLPFLIAESAGEVGRELNALIDLEVIDDTLSNAASMLNEARRHEADTEFRMNEAIRKKEELSWVMEFNERLLAVEALQKEVEEKTQKASELSSLIKQAKKLKRLASIRFPNTKPLEKILARLKELQKKAKELKTLISEAEKLEKEICRLKTKRKSLEKKLGKIKNCPLCGKML